MMMEMETGGSEMRRGRECTCSCVAANMAGAPAAFGCLPLNGSFAPSLARSVPRQGGAAASPYHHRLSAAEGHARARQSTPDLKRPSLSRLLHPPIIACVALGHGESNRRRTLQAEARDVAAAKSSPLLDCCGFLRLPPSPVSILLPAPPVFYVSHGTRRGTVSIVVVCCRRLACMQQLQDMVSAACNSHSTVPHLRAATSQRPALPMCYLRQTLP